MNDGSINILGSQLLGHAAFALFGGVVHALVAYRKGEAKTLLDIAILVIISSFSGVLFSLLASVTVPSQPYLIYAAAGAGGFLGVEGLSAISKKILAVLTTK